MYVGIVNIRKVVQYGFTESVNWKMATMLITVHGIRLISSVLLFSWTLNEYIATW